MTTIKAIVQDRRLELEVPFDWPDGTEVAICPLANGATGESDRLSPDEIVAALAALDAIEPFEMTDEEIAHWEAERKARKEREKSRFLERAEELRRHWE